MGATAYMRARVSRGFFAINISALPLRFKRLKRAQVRIHGTAGPLLGRAERSPPKARRVAPEGARVDGESACRSTMVCAAQITALLILPRSPLKFPITFVQSIQGGAPFAMRRSPHPLISGRGKPRTKVPHATCEGTGLQGRMGPFFWAAYCSHTVARSHIQPWNQ